VRQQIALQPEQRQAAAGASSTRAARAGARRGSSRPQPGDSPGADEASLWRGVGLVVDQLDGLVSGYNARVSELGPGASIDFITPTELLTLNSIGGLLRARAAALRPCCCSCTSWRRSPPGPV
jgi:hypothetical protein